MTKGLHCTAPPSKLRTHKTYSFSSVVLSELDLKSLENCSQVCRGFYLASQPPGPDRNYS